jgi:integrase
MYFYLENPTAKISRINIIHYLKFEKKNFKYSTGQKIESEFWDFGNRAPKILRGNKGIQHKHLSSILTQYSELLESELRRSLEENKPLTRSGLKQVFEDQFKHEKKQELNFIETLQEFIDSKNRSGAQSHTWNQKYSNLKAKLEAFQRNKKEIQFNDIDEDWLDSYSGFLRTIKIKPFKPHNDNTLHRNINFLFTFLIWAKGKYHNNDLPKNKVKKYQADDVHLTTEEVVALEIMNLTGQKEKVRDVFLIGVYSGQRFSDYSVFEKSDVQGDLIIKRAEKTEQESFIPLHGKLRNLLDKYDWELPEISSQKFNPHIQAICKAAGMDQEIKETVYRGNEKKVNYIPKWKMVSSHTARRTFITLSSEKGLPDHIIMKVTGIRNVQTLQKYKKTSQKSVIDQINKAWE